MAAVGGTTYYLGRPLRLALVARARTGQHVPAKFAGIVAGGIVHEATARCCIQELGLDRRLLDCLRRCDPPGIQVGRFDDALRRYDTSLYRCKADAHLRDDPSFERTLSRLLQEKGTVTIELVERILKHTSLGPGVFRSDPDFRRAYWTTSANATKNRRTIPRQRSLSASYPSRAVRPPSYADRVTAKPGREERKSVDQPVERISVPVSRNTSETNLVVRISAAEALDFDRVALALGLSRSTLIRQFVRQTISVARAGQAVAA